tara:strand:- start:162 stop:518 length:357 start_codon:yes stop_codon:yes gene_type:complete
MLSTRVRRNFRKKSLLETQRQSDERYLKDLQEKGEKAREEGVCYKYPKTQCRRGYQCAQASIRETRRACAEIDASEDPRSFFYGSTTFSSTRHKSLICERFLPRNVRAAMQETKEQLN